jgi:hypothetical protein
MYMGPEGFMLVAPDSGASFGASAATGSISMPFGFFS